MAWFISLGTGNDNALFDIAASTGVINFKTSPDFEEPSDAGSDNNYVIEVEANDGSNIATQTVTIKVTNLDDSAPTIVRLDPIDGSTISANERLWVKFTERIFKGTGKIRIRLS